MPTIELAIWLAVLTILYWGPCRYGLHGRPLVHDWRSVMYGRLGHMML